ncbi:hypothetical protein [Lysobacter silvisoli]|uniref:Uncharacterized protein n=1 Tax=Lysobacter silvisoli TaxID=2293254 RepID=A0A371JY94_9GAMM|nr:hypothetical protein [Lysobacter silvisoli]RDZ26592.1 hypothetical protein DX914_16540 [Lysobacter silvisoli]
MPYTINAGANALAIAEREWAAAANVAAVNGDTQPTIQFTAFTSCIGIAARNVAATQVIGIHLSIYDGNTIFTAADVPNVIAILTAQNYDANNVFIIGQTSAWEASVNAAYAALVAALPNAQIYTLGDGTYGAGISAGGALEPTY